MPIVKVKLEFEYYVSSEVTLEDDETLHYGVSEMYNICYDWIKEDKPPVLNFDIEEDVDVMGMYFDGEWHA
jgi:hypothetical protein